MPRGGCAPVSRRKRDFEEVTRCPPEEAEAIARHATLRRSGRVGRTAAAKEMQERPLVLAVVAAVRHGYTRYDDLLMSGMERTEARVAVRDEVDRMLADWRDGD